MDRTKEPNIDADKGKDKDSDLRYWLANEDWYPSRYTREWQERTPAAEAAEILARIADDAVAEPRAPWAVVATIVASAGLATSDGIGGKGPGARKAGTRAALMLAERNDSRAIPPLIRVFSTGGFLQSKYQSQIETALTRLLEKAEGSDSDSARFAPEVRALAARIWHSADRGDLTPARAALLAAAARFLHRLGGDENRGVLREIAASGNTGARQPERAGIARIVAALLAE